jgi:drug/metabolite transporter (DMT)-like permease
VYVSLALSPVVLLVDPGRWSVRDSAIGAVAGLVARSPAARSPAAPAPTRLPAPFFTPRGPTLAWTLAAGAIGICALSSMQLALRDGDSGVVSVAASQFGTATVLLSVAFNGERMRWWQALGVASSAIGVALLALG